MPTPAPVSTLYHAPAPVIVVLLGTTRCLGTTNVPAGTHTALPCAAAAAIADVKALEESPTPDASAPNDATEIASGGSGRGGATSSKSARSIVYEAAVSSASTWSRIRDPAGNSAPSSS